LVLKYSYLLAETGSGKTTQLPQYCAGAFSKLVICTQLWIIATLSLTKKITKKYDGSKVGPTIGYSVGGSNPVSRRFLPVDFANKVINTSFQVFLMFFKWYIYNFVGVQQIGVFPSLVYVHSCVSSPVVKTINKYFMLYTQM
jgi:hypothetical protein